MSSNNPLQSLEIASTAYIGWMALQNYSPLSVRERRRILGYFAAWSGASGITRLAQIDRVAVARSRAPAPPAPTPGTAFP